MSTADVPRANRRVADRLFESTGEAVQINGYLSCCEIAKQYRRHDEPSTIAHVQSVIVSELSPARQVH